MIEENSVFILMTIALVIMAILIVYFEKNVFIGCNNDTYMIIDTVNLDKTNV